MTAPFGNPNTWTDERVAELKRLWATGASAGQIAKAMGITSRNSIIGKAMRLGLTKRGRTAGNETSRITNKLIAAQRKAVKPVAVSGGRIYPQPAPVPLRDEPPTPDNVISLLSLEAHTCRWPYGTPGTDSFGFCGARTPRTYCADHQGGAYVSMSPSRTAAADKQALYLAKVCR